MGDNGKLQIDGTNPNYSFFKKGFSFKAREMWGGDEHWIPVNHDEIIFYRPNHHLVYYGSAYRDGQDYISLVVPDENNAVEYWAYRKASVLPSNNKEGLRIKNEAGDVIFNSDYKPLKIVSSMIDKEIGEIGTVSRGNKKIAACIIGKSSDSKFKSHIRPTGLMLNGAGLRADTGHKVPSGGNDLTGHPGTSPFYRLFRHTIIFADVTGH